MKNILIYTGPRKVFNEEHTRLARIQIDNSFDLGWKKEDILLVTDFPYEYNGVKSLEVPDGLYYDFDYNANKSIVLVYLLQQDIIKPRMLYWCHDFDAYENYRIKEEELGLEQYDLGLAHYTYKPEWQFGSLFLKSSVQDILERLDEAIRKRPRSSRNNEKKLTMLIKGDKIDNSRYKRLNSTYNFMKKYMSIVYPEAEKPLKVLHFLPSNKEEGMRYTALEMFMYGKNSLRIPLMSERLIKIFHHHGVR